MKEMYPDNQNQQNPYEFIVNPQQPSRGSRFHLPGIKDPFISKLVLIIAGVIIAVIIIGLVVSQLFKGNAVNTADLVGLAQTQQELSHIAQQGSQHGSQPAVQNLAINVRLAIDTNQRQLIQYLGAQNKKVNTKELNLKKNSATDAQLTNAIQSSTFDSVFAQVMQDSLVAYNTEIEQVSNNATGKKEKELLKATADAANMLLNQVPSQESIQAGS